MMFRKQYNIVLRRCDYVSKLTSKSSYDKRHITHAMFDKKSGALMTSKVPLCLFVYEYHHVFVYFIVGKY